MREKYTSRTGEEGVILLLSLFVIMLFSILVLEFTYTTRVEYHIASNVRDDLLAMAIARAGIYETIALLREDRLAEIAEKEKEAEKQGRTQAEAKKTTGPRDIQFPDHYGEDWARERYMEPIGEGYLTLKVIDESGRININNLVKTVTKVTATLTPTPTETEKSAEESAAAEEKKDRVMRPWGYKSGDKTGENADAEEEPESYVVDKNVEKDIMRLIETLDARGVKAEEVTAAIVDWVDSDDEGEWEELAYDKDSRGSPPKNAPLDILSELLMIKGVTADLYFGPRRPETIDLQSELSRRAPKRRDDAGLSDCLTVSSKVKVNVNTAPREVLAALLEEENDALIREIMSHRQKNYFKDLNEFEEEMGEHIPASFRAKIGVGSDCVQIIAEGRVRDSKKQIRTIVSRDDEANMKILYWRVER